MKKIFILPALILLLGFSSCSHDRNNPGYAYFPDMSQSVAYEAYAENAVYKDGKSMQMPVEGTIPREMIPYQYEKGLEGQQKAGEELVSPLEVSSDVLLEGQKQYDVFCVICHGTEGKGDGYLFTSKLFPAQPTDLTADIIQNMPDGEIYHIITHGSLSGLMGSHGSQIKPEDRWNIIVYLKNSFSQ